MYNRTFTMTALLLILSLATPLASASDSWFSSALQFFGLGDDAPIIESPAETPATPATPAPAAKQPTEVAKSPSPESVSAAVTVAELAQTPVVASTVGSLVDMVSNSLGVDSGQAQGGLGVLFGLAKNTLATSDFTQLSSVVPDMNGLLAAAPALSEKTSGLTSLMGKAGKYGNALQGATQAYAQFKSLGINPAQIPQYIDVTNEFLASEGGTETVNLFKKGVDALTTNQ
jgi:hypothetical protein